MGSLVFLGNLDSLTSSVCADLVTFFKKHMETSFFYQKRMLTNILLQFIPLCNMRFTCVVEYKISCLHASKLKLCYISKEKLKFCIGVWTPETRPQTSGSTLPSKISSRNSWKTAQLPKMLCNDSPLTVQRV